MGATHELKLEGYVEVRGAEGNDLTCEYHPRGLWDSDRARITILVGNEGNTVGIHLDQGQAQELVRFLTFFDGLIEARKVPRRTYM